MPCMLLVDYKRRGERFPEQDIHSIREEFAECALCKSRHHDVHFVAMRIKRCYPNSSKTDTLSFGSQDHA